MPLEGSRARLKLRLACEKAKRALCVTQRANIDIEALFDGMGIDYTAIDLEKAWREAGLKVFDSAPVELEFAIQIGENYILKLKPFIKVIDPSDEFQHRVLTQLSICFPSVKWMSRIAIASIPVSPFVTIYGPGKATGQTDLPASG